MASTTSTADLGKPKVQAAAERLAAVNPGVELRKLHAQVSRMTVARIVANYDLVVDGLDDLDGRPRQAQGPGRGRAPGRGEPRRRAAQAARPGLAHDGGPHRGQLRPRRRWPRRPRRPTSASPRSRPRPSAWPR